MSSLKHSGVYSPHFVSFDKRKTLERTQYKKINIKGQQNGDELGQPSKLKNSPTNIEVSKNGKAVYLKVKKTGTGKSRPSRKDSQPFINGTGTNENNEKMGPSVTNCSIDESNEPPLQVGGESIQYTADQYSFMNDEDHYNSNYLQDFKRMKKQATIQSSGILANNLSKLPSF